MLVYQKSTIQLRTKRAVEFFVNRHTTPVERKRLALSIYNSWMRESLIEYAEIDEWYAEMWASNPNDKREVGQIVAYIKRYSA